MTQLRSFLTIVLLLSSVGMASAQSDETPTPVPHSKKSTYPKKASKKTELTPEEKAYRPLGLLAYKEMAAMSMAFDPIGWMGKALSDSVRDGVEYTFGGGIAIPSSDQLSKAYFGYSLDTLIGFKTSESFSISFGIDGAGLGSSNDALTGGLAFNQMNIVLLGKFRMATGDVRPYLLFGPGIALNSHFLPGMVYGDPKIGEVDPMLEGGLGMEFRFSGNLFLFVQGGVTYDLISPAYASYISGDSPTTYIPIQMGIIFER